jgi:hypothetical protein
MLSEAFRIAAVHRAIGVNGIDLMIVRTLALVAGKTVRYLVTGPAMSPISSSVPAGHSA